MTPRKAALGIAAWSGYLFLMMPTLIVVPMSFGIAMNSSFLPARSRSIFTRSISSNRAGSRRPARASLWRLAQQQWPSFSASGPRTGSHGTSFQADASFYFFS